MKKIKSDQIQQFFFESSFTKLHLKPTAKGILTGKAKIGEIWRKKLLAAAAVVVVTHWLLLLQRRSLLFASNHANSPFDSDDEKALFLFLLKVPQGLNVQKKVRREGENEGSFSNSER